MNTAERNSAKWDTSVYVYVHTFHTYSNSVILLFCDNFIYTPNNVRNWGSMIEYDRENMYFRILS